MSRRMKRRPEKQWLTLLTPRERQHVHNNACYLPVQIEAWAPDCPECMGILRKLEAKKGARR